MHRFTQRRASGFTLTELAIVLAVVGVLSAGLYNLLSGANEQVRDQSAASQQAQLIGAVKAFLAAPQGQIYMTANTIPAGSGGCNSANCAQGASFALPLPNAACSNFTDTNWQALCTFLPPGFTSATTNSYGQTYGIRILRDATTLAGQAPATYSFMIVASGGNVIPDTSGARIASLIGGDGGFVYTNNVCGAPTADMACGAFGGWSSNVLTGYGFGASASGSIASRTYVSPQQNSFFSWLARVPISGDTNFSLNSMTTPEYIGGTANSYANELDMGAYSAVPNTTGGGTFNLQSGVFNFTYLAPIAPPGGATTGTMNVQGGTINLGGGTITDAVVFGNQIPINLTASGASTPVLASLTIDGKTTTEGDAMTITTGCTADLTAANTSGLPQVANCVAGLQVSGDEIVLGELTANSLYANTFIYQSSDMRLKTNIEPLADSLNQVMRMKPVTFNFRSTGQKGVGFIAQDIEKIYPSLVSENKDGMKAVNYEGLIAPLVSAVQELKQENDRLRAQLKEQQEREDRLEKEIKAAAP